MRMLLVFNANILLVICSFPQVMNRPASDPVFALAPSTLAKLKPLRDLYYIQRSIPDMAQYRTAHLLIKEWARSRGIYGAKFGLLGGIHILVLLAPVCKTLAQSGASYSVSDIVVTFFHHYAQMDWASEAIFDPFFHRDLHYHRTFREPLCLLGWHAPYLNTAANASKPTVETMAREFNRAAAILWKDDVNWDSLLEKEELWPISRTSHEKRLGRAVADFVCEHDSYIKIDLHHWGSSLTKGRRFTGWLESRLVTLLVGKYITRHVLP
jgi:hypothetical protein